MSTNIVVDVALSALRQLNQAQVNANRQAKLLADRNAKLAQKAVDADAAAKAQPGQGQDPRGALLYGVKSDRRRLQPQPVAVYHSSAPTALGSGWLIQPSDAAFNAVVRNLEAFAFSDEAPTGGYTALHFTSYNAGGGPLGANSLCASTTGVPGGYSTPYYLSWAMARSGIISEPSVGEFTFELMAKLPSPITDQDTLPFSYGHVYICTGSVEILVEQDQVYNGSIYQPFNSVRFAWGGRRRRIWNETNSRVSGTDIVANSAVSSGSWLHLAIVQTPGASASLRNVAYYLNGVRYFELPDLPAEDIYWDPGPHPAADSDLINSYGNGTTAPGSIADIPTLIHGIRFTPRALYSGASFTPPTSITSPA